MVSKRTLQYEPGKRRRARLSPGDYNGQAR